MTLRVDMVLSNMVTLVTPSHNWSLVVTLITIELY